MTKEEMIENLNKALKKANLASSSGEALGILLQAIAKHISALSTSRLVPAGGVVLDKYEARAIQVELYDEHKQPCTCMSCTLWGIIDRQIAEIEAAKKGE
jgi:hypothetical protein